MSHPKTLLSVATIFVTALLTASIGQAQSPDPSKARDKIYQFKKIKLVDILDLTGEAADKFIAKYNAGQKKIDDAKKNMDDSMKELRELMKSGGANGDAISAKTETVNKGLNAVVAASQERLAALKPMLTPEQYAKLVIFEIKFTESLHKLMMNRGGGMGGGKRRFNEDE